MNIVILALSLMLFLSNEVFPISNNYCINRLKNTGLRMFILKDKKTIKLFKEFKKKYKIYYEKSLANIGEGIIDYTALSEEEKTLIEAVISLCY